MIALHRLTQPDHEFYVNPDLIQQVEANPDTVVALTNGTKFLVSETPGEIADLVSEYRAGVLTRAITAPVVVNHPRVGDALGQVLRFPGGAAH